MTIERKQIDLMEEEALRLTLQLAGAGDVWDLID